ncbi:LamB/YcsF family protein [Virgibacillus xinjiangensis]|uniref:5-oxoprolinase subunit A n=1 Tax=Virgibacillus xinjiangensis TaxID=393090 RepID=A0ABV7CYR1_9BACI
MLRIDLNCDVGESFGPYTIGADEELMDYITSANIACGGHAGDADVMDRTIKLAKEKKVAVGAHPGYPDIAGFGRRAIEYSPGEIYRMLIQQIGALQAFCHVNHVPLKHVKPHGAMYNQAARNRSLAEAIVQAVYDVDSDLILYGLPGSELIRAGNEAGLKTVSEAFADRTYLADGSLTPRNRPDALITDQQAAVQQVERMVNEGVVEAVNGEMVTLEADTVCVHGDGPHAVHFVHGLWRSLHEKEIKVASPGSP